MYKFHSVDNGFCRIMFYKIVDKKRRYYCLQKSGRDEFEFFVCSSDGEPSHEVTVNIKELPIPDDGSSIVEEVKVFLEKQ